MPRKNARHCQILPCLKSRLEKGEEKVHYLANLTWIQRDLAGIMSSPAVTMLDKGGSLTQPFKNH